MWLLLHVKKVVNKDIKKAVPIHRHIKISPNGQNKNQIKMIAITVFVVLSLLLKHVPKKKRKNFVLVLYVVGLIFFWPQIKQIITDVDLMAKTEMSKSKTTAQK